jgi:carbon-monoxide dehydrogenase large subunit
MSIEGQLVGSIVQGVGAALFEEMRYDESGQPLTVTFMDYLMPQATLRVDVSSDRIVSPAPSNDLGAKGAGEGGCIGMPAAIVNAAIDALTPYGVTDLQIPLQPQRVWAALQAAVGKGPP